MNRPVNALAVAATGILMLVNLPRGERKVLIEVVDPEGRVFTAQTVTFKSPG